MTTTISRKGQITVPAAIREAIGLSAGTKIELKLGPAGTFVARKATKESHFAKFRGIGAKRGPGTSQKAIEALRGRVERGDVDP
ncbi:MAG: prlF antitoxin for toxin YhaV toxin [Verrucomicrobiota bacterium]|jgi:AbrB family looped-hinge helix DNA binding protein